MVFCYSLVVVGWWLVVGVFLVAGCRFMQVG